MSSFQGPPRYESDEEQTENRLVAAMRSAGVDADMFRQWVGALRSTTDEQLIHQVALLDARLTEVEKVASITALVQRIAALEAKLKETE